MPAKMCSPRQSTPASIKPLNHEGTRSASIPNGFGRRPCHAGALDRERRIDADRDLGLDADLLGSADRSPRLAFAFDVDRRPGGDRRLELVVALARTGEAIGIPASSAPFRRSSSPLETTRNPSTYLPMKLSNGS